MARLLPPPALFCAVVLTLVSFAALLSGDRAVAASAPTVHLTVRYDAGAEDAKTATLRCGRKTTGTGFLRTQAAKACRIARSHLAVLTTIPADDQICAQIYGGPQTASVTGRIGKQKVARRFARADGCQVADWTALQGLLPRVAAPAPLPVVISP
jgi:hypothetical protein